MILKKRQKLIFDLISNDLMMKTDVWPSYTGVGCECLLPTAKHAGVQAYGLEGK